MSFDSIKMHDAADDHLKHQSHAKARSRPRWFSYKKNKNPGRTKRSKMGSFRTVSTALSLIFAFFTLYAALFYIPAYKHHSELLSISTHKDTLANSSRTTIRKNPLDPYYKLFKIRRTYLRAGQTLNLRYSLPQDAELFIYVKRCHAPVFIEVFYCEADSPVKYSTKLKRVGEMQYKAEKAGLYLFDDMLFSSQSQPSKQPYMAVWTRK